MYERVAESIALPNQMVNPQTAQLIHHSDEPINIVPFYQLENNLLFHLKINLLLLYLHHDLLLNLNPFLLFLIADLLITIVLLALKDIRWLVLA